MEKINYNKTEKILSIRFSHTKSVDSDVRGNVVIDYDKNGKITNIDIMSINFDEFAQIQSHFPSSRKIMEKVFV